MACDIITECLIKGIIVTHSRTGITLHQISNVYYDCIGEQWSMLKRGAEDAVRYLDQIDGVLSIVNEKNETLWYVRGKTLNGEKRGQIYRANNQPKSDFDLSTNPHGNAANTCNQYNNNFRNARYTNSNGGGGNGNNNNNKRKTDRNNNGHNGDINGNYDPRNGKQPKYNKRMRGNGYSFGSSSSGSSSNDEQKTAASMYGYDLVGDDFFMEMAKIDLACSYTNRKGIQRTGLCISGQTIRDATERLRKYLNTDNMRIIVNLGTVDILHGRELTDICQDYMNLVKTCHMRNIQMVITTLAPIGNMRQDEADIRKVRDFNDFLYKRFACRYQIIDIARCMTDPLTDKLYYDNYQGAPKYVSGSSKPHLLWNRIGRQRILKQIKANLRY